MLLSTKLLPQKNAVVRSTGLTTELLQLDQILLKYSDDTDGAEAERLTACGGFDPAHRTNIFMAYR